MATILKCLLGKHHPEIYWKKGTMLVQGLAPKQGAVKNYRLHTKE